MQNDAGNSTDKFTEELRKRAQARLEKEVGNMGPLSSEEARKLIYELRTYQIELELQNEELRQTQERLLEAQQKFSDLYDYAPVGYLTISDKGVIVEANFMAAMMLNVERGNLVNQPLSAFVFPEDADAYYLCRQEFLRAQTPRDCEIRVVRKDGNRFHALVKFAINPEIDGIDGRFRVMISDITERKIAEEEKENLEEQLHQAHKMEAVGTLAGGIAHDFNNILTIIAGNAELLSDDIPADNPKRESLEEIINASNRARDLVSQILAFSRKEKKVLIPVSPQLLIKETLKLLHSTTPTTISVVQRISQDCGKIKSDLIGLHQVLMNLVTNAVHSMDEKGEVTVNLEEVNLGPDELNQLTTTTKFFSIKTPGTYARLSVTDTGAGMDEETVDRIFDPFYTTKEVGKGTGMGLSVVYGIVESHGGFIDVDSEPGRGSTFHVYFPITEVEGDLFEVETEALPMTGTERILVIDDEESLLALGKRILDRLGYEVTAENSSVKALEIFKSAPHQFDLIITDQAMPDMSGIELVAEILKARPDIPVILCTGFSSKVSVENAREKGISKFITKPYTKKILAEAVREVLDGKL